VFSCCDKCTLSVCSLHDMRSQSLYMNLSSRTETFFSRLHFTSQTTCLLVQILNVYAREHSAAAKTLSIENICSSRSNTRFLVFQTSSLWIFGDLCGLLAFPTPPHQPSCSLCFAFFGCLRGCFRHICTLSFLCTNIRLKLDLSSLKYYTHCSEYIFGEILQFSQ